VNTFKSHKHRLSLSVMTSIFSLCITGLGTSQSHAQQSSEPRVLPPVSVDAPRERTRKPRIVRPRSAPQSSAPTVQRQAEQPPATPPTTMGTTRTIGAPAPAYAGGQIAQGGTLGLLGSTSVMNTPFSTVNYTSKLIENQQARTAADVLINDASVRVTTAANGFDDTFQIRGFSVPAQDVGFNGLYGLISSNRALSEYIERIELLKGPGALMNGMAPGNSVGGGINIVTKRAGDVDFNRITPFFMSSGNFGAHLETSKRFGANKEWGIRFNGVGRKGEASIDGGDWQSALGALAVDYRSDRFRWTLDAITQNDDTDNFRPQIGFATTLPFIPAPPDARKTWYPGVQLRQRDNTVATSFEYDVTNWLTAYAAIGYRDGRNDQTFPDSRVGAPFNTSGVYNTNGDFRLINAYYDSYSKTTSGNAGVRAKFDTGPIGHSINVAYTGYYQENGNAYVAAPAAQSVVSNIYNPAPLMAVPGARLDPTKANEVSLKSIAAADTLSFLNERILLTLGARHQTVHQDSFSTTTGLQTGVYGADKTSPMAGIVVKPWQNVSLYANYAEGLSQGSVVGAGFANAGSVLDPYVSKQKEFGVKIDWGTITTTAAWFEISRPNLITTAANVRAYDGEQRNRGIELNAYGLLLPGLRGMVSYAFVQPEITKSSNAAEIGQDAAGVPRHRATAGLEWDTPWVSGLSVNGRVIYTSEAYLTTANTVTFPAWTRVDAGLRYETKLNGRPVTLRASIENLFNESYWITTGTFATVGSPRTYILSAAFDF